MKTVTRFVMNRPWFILAVAMVVTAFFGFEVGTKYEVKKDLFDGELPEHEGIAKIQKAFGKNEVIAVLLENPRGIWNPRTLEKIIMISERLEEIPGVRRGEVLSIATLKVVRRDVDGRRIEENLLETIPETPEMLATVAAEVMANPLVRDIAMVSSDETATRISASLEDAYEQEIVAPVLTALAKEFTVDSETVSIICEPVLNEDIRVGVNSDALLVVPALLFRVLFAGLFLGSIVRYGLLLNGLATILTVIWTIGVSVLLGFEQSVVMSCVPPIMVAIAGTTFIQFLNAYLEERRKGTFEPLQTTLHTMGSIIWFTVITTVAGFGSLVNFQVASIAHFGVTVALGSFFSWCMMLVQASILKLFPKLGAMDRMISTTLGAKAHAIVDVILQRCLTSTARLVARWPQRIIIASGVILVASSSIIPTLRVGDDPVKLFPEEHRIHRDAALFAKHGGFKKLELALEVSNVMDPNILRFVEKAQTGFKARTGTYTISFVTMVKYWNWLHNGSYTTPATQREVENLFRMYGSPRDRREWIRGRHFLRIVVMVNELDQGKQIKLQETLDNDLRTLAEETQSTVGKVQWWWGGNEVMFWTILTKVIFVGKMQNVVLAPFAIFLLVWWRLKRWKLGLISLIPLIQATIVTFGVMAALDIRLTIATSIIAGVATGIGADYAIQFLERVLEEIRRGRTLPEAVRNAIMETGKAIVADATSMALGFLILLFSAFTPLQDMGLLVAVNMGGCALSTLFTLAALLVWKKEMFEPLFWKEHVAK